MDHLVKFALYVRSLLSEYFVTDFSYQPSLVALKTSQGWGNFWTGLARGGDGSFSWVDESPYDFEFWLAGEPNAIDGDGEDCVEAYYVTAEWNDAFCSEYKGAVCMVDKGRKPNFVQYNMIKNFPVIQSSPAPTGAPTTNPNSDGTTKHTEPWDTTPKHTEPWDTTPKHTEPWDTTPKHTEPWDTTPTQHNDIPTTPKSTTKGKPSSKCRSYTQETLVLGGMGGGAIAAIIIAVLIVGGLAGVMVVMLRSRDWDVRRLVPPQASAIFSSGDKTMD